MAEGGEEALEKEEVATLEGQQGQQRGQQQEQQPRGEDGNREQGAGLPAGGDGKDGAGVHANVEVSMDAAAGQHAALPASAGQDTGAVPRGAAAAETPSLAAAGSGNGSAAAGLSTASDDGTRSDTGGQATEGATAEGPGGCGPARALVLCWIMRCEDAMHRVPYQQTHALALCVGVDR